MNLIQFVVTSILKSGLPLEKLLAVRVKKTNILNILFLILIKQVNEGYNPSIS